MNFAITNFNNKDYPFLKEMIFGLYQEDSNSFEEKVMTEIKIKNTINRSITHPDQVKIKIFKVNATVVGYATLTFYWSNEYNGLVVILDELFILPEYRNRGISTLFINQLAQEKEYKMIDLEVFKENTRALALYKRLGFEIIDRHFMKKIL
jgi:GNAT superfamily N-acetyltransferase